MVDKATDYVPRFQFEESSGSLYSCQVWNCGPAGAAQQVDYYLGRHKGQTDIDGLRTKTGTAHGGPTTAWEQAEMLTANGVPAAVVEITSIEQLERLVGYGDRPVGIGILMSRLKAATRGHDFLGWHRVTILTKKGRRPTASTYIRGFTYTDPNFRPPGSGFREDPAKGHRWISRNALEKAFVQNWPAYAIVPLRRKR